MSLSFFKEERGWVYKLLVLGVALSLVSVSAYKILQQDGPTADAGGDKTVLLGESVTFDGSNFTGNLKNYTWFFRDNSESEHGKVVTHTFDEEGIYQVGLVVNNSDFQMDLDYTTVRVKNYAPEASLYGPYQAMEDESVTFDWSASDNSSDDLTYEWNFGDGETRTLEDPSVPVTHSYKNRGNYTVTLVAKDPSGATAVNRTYVNVTNVKPDADFTVPQGTHYEDDPVSFDASPTTDNSSDLPDMCYHWSFGDGSQSKGETASHVYTKKGDYDVTLTVEDDNNETDQKTKTVTVENPSPSAEIKNIDHIEEGMAKVLTSTTSDNPSDRVHQTWSTGEEGRKAVHRWEDSGSYDLSIGAEDDATDSYSQTVDVDNAVPHPFIHSAYIEADLRLRIAGEPCHDTNMTLYEDGEPIHEIQLWRQTGTPQVGWIRNMTFDMTKTYTAKTHYTPENDNDSGPHGANPAWIDVFFQDGSWERIQHPFNEAQPDTYWWNTTINKMFIGHNITFESKVLDQGADDITTSWHWGDGDSTVNQYTSGESPTLIEEKIKHNYSDLDHFTVQLTAQDEDGAAETFELVVNQSDGGLFVDNVAPNPEAGPDKSGIEDENIGLNATLNETCNNTVQPVYSWHSSGKQLQGSQAHISYGYEGRYLVILSITDQEGATGYDHLFVDVSNQAPAAGTGNDRTVKEDEPVAFSAMSSSDAPSDTLKYYWDFGDGTTGHGPQPTKTYPENGQYTATVTVVDDDNVTDTETVTITVENKEPEAVAYDPVVTEGESFVLFGGESIDTPSDKPLLEYKWTTPEGNTSEGKRVTLSFEEEGSRDITLNVTDDDGSSNSATIEIKVKNKLSGITYLSSPRIYGKPMAFEFRGSISDPTDSMTYTWNWGDGSPEETTSEPCVTHTYDCSGTYSLKLTADDGTDKFTKEVAVSVGVDNDSDGLTNVVEDKMNTDQNDPDTDGDHLLDYYERTEEYKTDPTKKDTDEDNMSDWYELSYFGGLNIDLDGDGIVCQLDWDSDGDLIPDGEDENPAKYDVGLPSASLMAGDKEVRQTPKGKTVRFSKSDSYSLPGGPTVPVRHYRFLLPPEAKIESVSVGIVQDEQTTYTDEFWYPPASFSRSHPGDNFTDVNYSWVYELDRAWPSRCVKLTQVAEMRKATIVEMDYFPIQYNPTTKNIIVHQNTGINLNWEEKNDEIVGDITRKFLSPMKDHIDNYNTMISEYSEEQSTDQQEEKPGYAIITTQAILASSDKIGDFIQFKQKCGFNVHVVTEDDFGGQSSDSGIERAKKIREWLASNVFTENIQYALLIGDPDPDEPDKDDSFGNIPMLECRPKGIKERSAATDYYYSDLIGTWDHNGNGTYGEYPEDKTEDKLGIDFMPEVIVGRIPVYNPTNNHLDSILTNIMGHPTEKREYRKKILEPMAMSNYAYEGGNLDVPRTDGRKLPYWINETITKSLEMNDTGMYEGEGKIVLEKEETAQYDYDINAENFVSEYNKGQGLVFNWAHGDKKSARRTIWYKDIDNSGFPEKREYKNKPLLNNTMLENGNLDSDQPSFFVQASCLNGKAEYSNNLAYNLLKKGMAISTFSGTDKLNYKMGQWKPEWIDSSDDVSLGYWYTYELIKEEEKNGMALSEAKMLGGNELRSESWINKMAYNLYGDPQLSYWVHPPTSNFNYEWSDENPNKALFYDQSVATDASIESWVWQFGDGAKSTQKNPSHTYSAPGTYTVKLTVTTNEGTTDTYQTDIEYAAEPPHADFTYTPSHGINTGEQVNFESESTDPDGHIDSHQWHLNGGVSTAENPTYTYSSPGTYNVELTVTDDDGNTDTCIKTLQVYDDTTPPTLDITRPGNHTSYDSNQEGINVVIVWEASDSGGIDHYEIKWSGPRSETDWSKVGTSTSHEIYCSNGGTYKVWVKAVDEAGNVKIHWIKFYVNIGPTSN